MEGDRRLYECDVLAFTNVPFELINKSVGFI